MGAKAAKHRYRHLLAPPSVCELTFSKSIGMAPPAPGAGQKTRRRSSSTFSQTRTFLHSFFRQYWVGGNPCLGVSASTSAWLRLQIFTNLGIVPRAYARTNTTASTSGRVDQFQKSHFIKTYLQMNCDFSQYRNTTAPKI